jgi:radical SAM superfamily enzyme YgiQ (UPF0313 family)
MKNKVMLIAMPWHQADILSLQQGCLKSFLKVNSIKVDSRHYYKDVIDYIGLDVYKKILYSNIGELLFADLLFPEKMKNIKSIIKNKLKEVFDQVLRGLKKFINDILNDVAWKKYCLVGFTTTHEQIVSSLLLAKLLKLKFPSIKIVFGGMLLIDDLARNLVNLFPFVDYVIMGEGEVPLLELVHALRNNNEFPEIPSLIHIKKIRKKKYQFYDNKEKIYSKFRYPTHSRLYRLFQI